MATSQVGEPVVVRARGRDHGRLGRCRWRCAGSGCSRRRGSTTASLARRARTSSPTRRGRSCRRRSVATRSASSRRRGATPAARRDLTAIVVLERGARRRRNGAARRGRLPARPRPVRRGAYLWLEGAFVFGTVAADRRVLLALGTAAARSPASPARAGPARAAAAGVLRRRPPLPRSPRTAAEGLRLHDGDPGRADPLDLGLVQGGGDRARAAHLLRHGPAVLPRPARAVHAERVRRARGVLRQLPRQRRRRCRRGLRGRVPLLPRHGRARAAGRRASCSGRAFAAAPGRGSSMDDVGRRRRHLQRDALARAVPRERRAAPRPSSSTTAPPTARVAFVRERFPDVRVLERANRGLAAGWNVGLRRDVRAVGADAQRRRMARRTMPSSGSSRSATAIRTSPSSGRGCSTRTARCSARCAGFPTRWRLATEYLYLRKLAPRSRAPERLLRGRVRPRRPSARPNA